MDLKNVHITNEFTKGDLIIQSNSGDKICIHLTPIQCDTAKAILGIDVVKLDNREFDVFMLEDNELLKLRPNLGRS
jgi:hypothetical protein